MYGRARPSLCPCGPVACSTSYAQPQLLVKLPAARQAHLAAAPQLAAVHRRGVALPLAAGPGGRGTQGSSGGLDPSLEIEVPKDQRPVNELASLKADPLYSWATLELGGYAARLAVLFAVVFVALGGPISAQTFDPARQPLEFALSASTGALLVVALASLRIYLGWKYVGDRLLTAALPYEETGWYDGQVFVKPPEVLTRDRLLGMYEVRPVLARLRTTLQATGGALAAIALILTFALSAAEEDAGVVSPAQVTPGGVIYSSRVKALSELVDDDEAAEAEAMAQPWELPAGGGGGRCNAFALHPGAPGFCG